MFVYRQEKWEKPHSFAYFRIVCSSARSPKASGFFLAAEAIHTYQANFPILTTMDLNMPDMTGIDVIRKIREFDPEANIMMCSALEQKTMIIEAIHAGAKEFVSKPFQEHNMKETMLKLLVVSEEAGLINLIIS